MIKYISVLLFLLFQIEIYANKPQLNGQVYSNKLVSVSKGKNSIILQFDNQFKHILNKDFQKYINFFDLIGKNILHTIKYRPFGPLIQLQFEIDKSIFLIGLNYKIDDIKQKEPDLGDMQTRNEIVELVYQKNKFDYNKNLLDKIRNKQYNNDDFLKIDKDKIENLKLNSIKDNKKFNINAVEILYSLPVNTFTLINDEEDNIYIAKVKKFQNVSKDNEKFKEYANKQNSNIKNTMLKSYDLFLNDKYNVVLNQKTVERVKNFFQ